MVFLMITCDCYRTIPAATPDASVLPTNLTTPSFDFNITTQHSSIVANS